jgi:hypothetical protein
MALIERICEVVTEDDRSLRVWKELLTSCPVIGVAVHDARLASVMLTRGIPTVITLNERDFRRYGGIIAISPDKV